MKETILFLILNLFGLLTLFGQKSPNVEVKFENIIGIGKITLSNQDYDKLYDYLSASLEKTPDINEDDFFVSQEILDFSYDSSVFVYQYFDWKEYSSSIEYFAEQELAVKYRDTTEYISPLWVDGERADSLQYIEFASTRLIGEYLYQRGYSLFNIDCDCDCYRLIIIPNPEIEKIEKFSTNLNCELESHRKQW